MFKLTIVGEDKELSTVKNLCSGLPYEIDWISLDIRSDIVPSQGPVLVFGSISVLPHIENQLLSGKMFFLESNSSADAIRHVVEGLASICN